MAASPSLPKFIVHGALPSNSLRALVPEVLSLPLQSTVVEIVHQWARAKHSRRRQSVCRWNRVRLGVRSYPSVGFQLVVHMSSHRFPSAVARPRLASELSVDDVTRRCQARAHNLSVRMRLTTLTSIATSTGPSYTFLVMSFYFRGSRFD